MKRLLVTIACLGLISCKTLTSNSTPETESSTIDELHQAPERLPAPEIGQDADLDNQAFDINQVAIQESDEPELEDLWQYIAERQTLAKTNHQRVNKFRKQYLKHSHHLNSRAEKAAPYLHYIINELEKRNMPIELAFTPMVESNFDPLAHSVVQAAGLWQFMPRTAKGFGLKIDEWYDGRRDVVQSTKAALDYYQYLNKMFDGDWLLTVAAYNAGEGNVLKAIKANKRAGKATDYWSLKLPKETMRHVPKWIALSDIYLNSHSHKLQLPELYHVATFTEVEVKAPANLMQLAKIANIDKDIFYRLNPAYNRLFVPQHHGKATILVPISKLDHFQTGLMNIDTDALIAATTYSVKSGDNLSTIAQKHNTSVNTLKSLNHLKSDVLKIGQLLKMPGSIDASEYEKSFFATLNKNQQRRRYQSYRVRSGDSLWKIAKKFKVSTSQLVRWNGLNKNSILKIGQKIKVFPNGYNSFASAAKTYKVGSGDSLYSIAKKFKVSINQLTQWNGINKKSYLQPGQVLKVAP